MQRHVAKFALVRYGVAVLSVTIAVVLALWLRPIVLAAAQLRFRDLVNSAEGIVWEADAATHQFSFVSDQSDRILGYPPARWLSKPTFWKDHLHPDDREWAVSFCEQATAEKREHDLEYRMIAADGSVVWLRDVVTVVLEGDQPARVRGAVVDITERKRAEQERRARRRAIDSM